MRYKAAAAILSGFTNRAQSVTIGRGVWELCDGPRFTGRCVTLETSVPDLDAHGLRSRVASVRPVKPQAQPR
jgi:Beta/Gamma crystallin